MDGVLSSPVKPVTEGIARVCHEANRAFCILNDDDSQKSWEDAEEWQRKSAIDGVVFRITNSDAPASAQHEAWMQSKLDDGWVYGKEKSTEKKTHPCLVPYEQLPDFQRKKDALFIAIVDALFYPTP